MRRDLSLRPIAEDDRELLYLIYASTRADELAVLDWGDAQKEMFLRMQFDVQDRCYRDACANPDFALVLLDGQPIGRLYVDRAGGRICLVDIALLPEYRHAGIGGCLIRELQAEAAQSHQSIYLHVTPANPARRLYERLGFRQVDETAMHVQMEWHSN